MIVYFNHIFTDAFLNPKHYLTLSELLISANPGVTFINRLFRKQLNGGSWGSWGSPAERTLNEGRPLEPDLGNASAGKAT
jgi:hypothetical protein